MVSLPSERSTRFGNPAWPGFKTANFAALGAWSWVLPKNAESLGTAMRSCVSLFRGVAAPLGCVIFFAFVEIGICTSGRSWFSACARHGWYHYPRRAPRVVETLDGRLPRGLICRFLRSGGRSSPHDSYFLADTQNFLLAVPVANAFALWYDKFSKLEFVLLVIIFGGLFFPVCHNIFNHCNTLIFSSSFIIFLHIAENMSAWF